MEIKLLLLILMVKFLYNQAQDIEANNKKNEKRQINNMGPGYTQNYLGGGMGGFGGVNNYGAGYMQTYGKRNIAKRQVENRGTGYTQKFESGTSSMASGVQNIGSGYTQIFAGGSGSGVNNIGAGYSQTYEAGSGSGVLNLGNAYQQAYAAGAGSGVINQGTGYLQKYGAGVSSRLSNINPANTQGFQGQTNTQGFQGLTNNIADNSNRVLISPIREEKRSATKRQVNNFGAGYQQSYMGGFGGMGGGFGGVNNIGNGYSQTYGKRNIGQANHSRIALDIANYGHNYTQNHFGAIDTNIKNNGNNYQINAIPPLANNVFNNGKNYSYNFDLMKQGLNISSLLFKNPSLFLQQFKNPTVYNNPGVTINKGDNLVQQYNFGRNIETPTSNNKTVTVNHHGK